MDRRADHSEQDVALTRESKLALIIGITLILLVGVLLSDHLSGATEAQFDTPETIVDDVVASPLAMLPGAEDPIEVLPPAPQALPLDQSTGMIADQGGIQPAILGNPTFTGSVPMVISQGVNPQQAEDPNRIGVIANALDTLGNSVADQFNGIASSNPPSLVATGMFEPVDREAVTLPPRGDEPIKTVTDRPGSITAAQQSQPRLIVQQNNAPAQNTTRTAWKTHTVAEGDSLYRLAATYLGDGEKWRELQKINADVLNGGINLKVGMKLKVVQATVTTVAQKPAAQPKPAAKTETKKEQQAKPAQRSYVVLKGDNLGTISQKLLGSSRRMSEIVKLNGLKDPNDIRVGQTLKIPAR